MLNFKKGLAIVLAAATALTFAPVSNFGAASVVANAAAAATGKETTGGVLKTVPLYNGETIDLIENASISYDPDGTGKNAVNYYKSSLTWYLTKESGYAVGDTLTGDNAKKAPTTFQVKPADGSITAGKGVLSFKVTDANEFAKDYPAEGLNVVAAYPVNGKDMTVVYTTTIKVANIVPTATDSSTKVVAANDINISFSASQKKPSDLYKGLFDSANAVDTDDLNKYVDLSKTGNNIEIVTSTTFETGANFNIKLATGSATDGRAVFKPSTVEQNSNLTNGTYYETGYVAYKVNGRDTINIAKINLVASVSTGPKVRVKDNGLILASSYEKDNIAKDPTVYLNLKTNKTYDIAAHLESDIAGTTYTYKSNYSNITVDAKGVVTAKTAGPAEVEITPKAGDVSGDTITLYFQVNANPFATFTVSGKDSDTSDVLDGKVYDNNVTSLTQEYNLAAAQVKYIQIEDNGNETSDIKEPLKVSTTATGAAIHFVFAATNSNTEDGMVINDRTGEITVPYGQARLDKVAGHAYAVKVDVAATANTEATTGYFYFVVDYSDSTPAGLEDAYTVGTDQGVDKAFSKSTTDEDAWQEVAISFGNEVSGATVINYVGLNNTYDALKGTDLYKDSKIGDFATTIKNDDGKTNESAITSQAATKATVDDAKTNAGSVAYVLVDFQKHVDSTKKYCQQGHTYRIVKLTGAEGKTNLVTSIVNADTNETVYDSAKDSLYAPKLAINGVTHLTVTLAYPVDKNNTKFNIYSYEGNNGVVVNQPYYVTAVKSNKVSIALYPNSAGTQVIYIEPSGNISKTDRTITRDNKASFAVTYSGALVKPSKVTGLKVTNKKGAKVSVKFKKVKSYPTMLYYVQKKVGKKTSGKTVGSTKTSLSVAKGKTVKVRVKAYYFDTNGTKHVGKYSSWKTLKTDKK